VPSSISGCGHAGWTAPWRAPPPLARVGRADTQLDLQSDVDALVALIDLRLTSCRRRRREGAPGVRSKMRRRRRGCTGRGASSARGRARPDSVAPLFRRDRRRAGGPAGVSRPPAAGRARSNPSTSRRDARPVLRRSRTSSPAPPTSPGRGAPPRSRASARRAPGRRPCADDSDQTAAVSSCAGIGPETNVCKAHRLR
jgi:hypothetical protein